MSAPPLITPLATIAGAQLVAYDTERFPFARLLARTVFRVPSLERLHVYLERRRIRRGVSPELCYADNIRLRMLMQSLTDDSPFYRLYHAFVRAVVRPAFGGPMSYTSHPKMRVHLAGTPSVSAWHRDADVTGRLDNVNAWLPFTDAFGTNTLWIESDYGREDYQPVPVPFGSLLVFDGGLLRHGTVANDTPSTRVSLDFRFAIRGVRTSAAAAITAHRRP